VRAAFADQHASPDRLLHQYIREKFPKFPPEDIPCRTTLTTVCREWFGPDGARQRYVRSAEAAKDAYQRVGGVRPGQVVALDSTPLPVKVLETVFGDPVSVMLTLALDLCTHSIVAFRLTLVSDTSVDIAMLLRDVMMPLPMREGWGEEMEWPYPGTPAAVVAQFAGHKVAVLPFFAPETVTTDHGGRLSNAFFPVGVTAVAWCAPLPTSRPRKTSMSPVSITCRPLRSRFRPALPRHRAATSTLRRALPARVKPVLKPLISGPSMPPGPVTPPPRIMNNKGGKSCRTRRPEAPLRSHEKGNCVLLWPGMGCCQARRS
jgi:hypothetical protein